MHFEILLQTPKLVAINKPAGMLVHRSALSRERTVVLQGLRAQLGRRLYPVHRLDRATSGVLVFAFDPDSARQLAEGFQGQQVDKRYLAIVRGWPEPPRGLIDRPVRDDDRAAHREARSRYRRLATTELPVPNRRYPGSRYALMLLAPETGRRHQLRIHMERIAHPIIGDTTHGDGEHNRIFREHLGQHRLMLHAWSLALPGAGEDGKALRITAPPPADFHQTLAHLGWSVVDENPFLPP